MDTPQARADRIAAFHRLACGRQGEPRLHHLPGRQAVPHRHEARRPALDLRAQLPALHGPRHRAGRHALDVLALPALALRELPRCRRDARTATTRSTCRSPATPPATSTSTTCSRAPDGRPIFVATRFNCLATLAERASFAPLWRPPFIDRLAAEDRCHLNGFAAQDGRPAYATCVAATNIVDGWREHRRDGGLVIDIATGETVAAGLSMPHSPRLYRGKLWLVQSGTGEFGHVDVATGRFEPVCFLQGFARGAGLHRGLCGHRRVAAAREPHLRRPRAERAAGARGRGAAVPPAVVNLTTGDVEHRLIIEGVVEELYDVAVLPGVIRPSVIGFRSDEIRFLVRPEDATKGPLG